MTDEISDEDSFNKDVSVYDLKRGIIYKVFFIVTAFSTAWLVLTVLMPLSRRVKTFLSRILNWKFTYYGMELSLYSCITIYLKFLAFMFCCKNISKYSYQDARGTVCFFLLNGRRLSIDQDF